MLIGGRQGKKPIFCEQKLWQQKLIYKLFLFELYQTI